MKTHAWPRHPKFAKFLTFDQHAVIRELECSRANELANLRSYVDDLWASVLINLNEKRERLNAKGTNA